MNTARSASNQSIPTIDRLRVLETVPTRSVFAQKIQRPDGEVIWRHPFHRMILPPSTTRPHPVVLQIDGGRTRKGLWNEHFGFFPADVQFRSVASAATTVQLLWRPDPETNGKLEPMLPFHDSFISMNARAIALELDSDSPDPLFIESLGHAIVVRYLRQFSTHTIEIARPSGLSRERLRRVLDYVEAHLADALTLDALAGVACLSPFHLSRSFQRSMGIGLHRYVVQRRIDRAKQLVVSTDLAITQIAAAVGFESAAAFSTRFRQFVGRPPSSLRDG